MVKKAKRLNKEQAPQVDKVMFHPHSKEYTQESLKEMSREQLLELRNTVASNLGIRTLRDFSGPGKAIGVKQTWTALCKYHKKCADEENTKPKPITEKIAAKEKEIAAEPKSRKGKGGKGKALAKGTEFTLVKRPQKGMFDTIKKIGEPSDTTPRKHRWPNYTDGMMVIDVFTTEGCIMWDVKEWCKEGIMKRIPVDEKEYEKIRAGWFKSQDRKDPLIMTQQNKKDRQAEARKVQKKVA